MKKNTGFSIRVLFLITLICLPNPVHADNIEAQLSTTDGSDAFQVQDSTGSTLINVLSNGKIGIGMLFPSWDSQFAVTSSGNNWVIEAIASDNSSLGGFYETAAGAAEFYVRDETGNNNVIIRGNGNTVFNGGNVGIGTSTPSSGYALDINGDTHINGSLELEDATVVGLGNFNGSGALAIYSAKTERIRIDSSGNVGIGTTTTGGVRGKVVIEASGSVAGGEDTLTLYNGISGADNGSQLRFRGVSGSTEYAIANIAGAWSSAGSGGELRFSTMNSSTTVSEHMRIDESGNVGIGTTSPGAALEVNGGIKITCPSGFTSIEVTASSDGVVRQLGCIQNSVEAASANCQTAILDCFDTYGGRLPSYNESYLAVQRNAATLTDEGVAAEWLDGTSYHNNPSTYTCSVIASSANNYQPAVTAYTANQAYRCFIPK